MTRFCITHVSKLEIIREKERYQTQSYDKSPTPTEKSKKQSDNTQTPPKTSITQRLRTDLGRSNTFSLQRFKSYDQHAYKIRKTLYNLLKDTNTTSIASLV